MEASQQKAVNQKLLILRIAKVPSMTHQYPCVGLYHTSQLGVDREVKHHSHKDLQVHSWSR